MRERAENEQGKLEAMRKGGRILGEVLQEVREFVKPGVSEREVDAMVRREIVRRGGEVAYDFLEVKFPGAICISTNDQLVHGVPTDYVFEAGDVVSFDLDVKYGGYYTDAAFTMVVGGEKAAGAAVRQMIKTAEEAMWAGIAEVRAGARIGDIGYAVEKVLRRGKLGVVMNYIGHGIGRSMHEEPEVPNYGRRGTGYRLKAGDVICIEPMASLGKAANFVGDDGWTVFLKDGSLGVHCEHTVWVGEEGGEVLTSCEF